eukprot:953909-Prorocentrum_minimum.AAC.1
METPICRIRSLSVFRTPGRILSIADCRRGCPEVRQVSRKINSLTWIAQIVASCRLARRSTSIGVIGVEKGNRTRLLVPPGVFRVGTLGKLELRNLPTEVQ